LAKRVSKKTTTKKAAASHAPPALDLPAPVAGAAVLPAPPDPHEAKINADALGMDLPPVRINGQANPEFFRRAYEVILMNGLRAANSDQPLPVNLDKLREFIDQTAQSHGFDPKRLQDRRSDGEILDDAIERLAEDPDSYFENEVWARIDKLIDRIKDRMDEADAGCEEYIDAKKREVRLNWGKAMRRRAMALRRLRERATMPVPPPPPAPPTPSQTDADGDLDIAIAEEAAEAAHPLRYMAYVGRSNMDTVKRTKNTAAPEPHDFVYQWGPHHYKMACDIWIARNGVAFDFNGGPSVEALRGEIPYEGAIVIMPVGHGKTEFACAYMALEVNLRPRVQGVMLHAVDEKAWENLQYVEMYFDAASDFGRRSKSLFPKLAVTQSTNKRFRVDAGQSLKSPTLTASGVNKASLGSNTTFQLLDDVVPQSDAEQPTDRDRRKRLLSGTWGTRMRGQNTFKLMIGTLWHSGDALMAMMAKADRYYHTSGREGVCYLISKQECGGIQDGFTPLWDIYSREYLRRKYYDLGPHLYSAAFMSNPLTDEQKLVKRLRLYDPEDRLEAMEGVPAHERTHAKFLASCLRYLSLDPSATNGERSDKAGVLYAGLGAVTMMSTDEAGNPVRQTEKRLRAFKSTEIGATQSDLVDHTLNFAMTNPVDYVMVETRSGFRGIAEMFEGKGVDVIRLDPKNKKKIERLRSAAVALEDANAPAMRAVVEFPGVWTVKRNADGSSRMELEIDPSFEKLQKQIIDFGVAEADHSVDCTTQLVNELLPELSVGRGAVTQAIVMAAAAVRNERKAVELAELGQKKKEREASADLGEWLGSNMNNRGDRAWT
jgi:hypothetical protein